MEYHGCHEYGQDETEVEEHLVRRWSTRFLIKSI